MFFSRRFVFSVLAITVICWAAKSSAGDLVQPPSDAPLFELSNLRIESGRFGKNMIVFDYRRTRQGNGRVELAGKSDSGPINFAFPPQIGQDSGEVQLESIFGQITSGVDLELYLVQRYPIDASTSVLFLVSNPVRIGNPGPVSQARALSEDEKAKQAEYKRIMSDDSAHKPTKSYPVSIKPPKGADFVPATAKVTKGTAMQACYSNNWHPIEALSENDDGTINVSWPTFPGYFYAMSRGELVITSEQLARLGTHPVGRFPKTVPNWASPNAKDTPPPSPDAKQRKSYPVSIGIPSGWKQVPQDLKVPEGIALQACYANKWNPLTALGENEDGTLNVRWDQYGSGFDCSMVRDELIIQSTLATQLQKDPSSVKVEIKPLRRKDYTVSIPIPSDSVAVPSNAVLDPGTKLQACYAGSWNPITFLSHASDGTLNIRWDQYGEAFDCSMTRDQLIIKKSDLTATPPVESMRWFTDKTGRFRVQASILEQTDEQVVLLTDKGKRLELPISKLSKEDQDFLRSTKDAVNPFE